MEYCRFGSYFTFAAKEKLCSFYCYLVKGGECWKLVSNLPCKGSLLINCLLIKKKTKSSKSIPGFSISRLANVKDFFNVNIFFECKYVRINDYSFKSVCIACSLKTRFHCFTFSALSNLNSADFTTPNSQQRFWLLK